jgi:hypothetical protein
METVVDVPDGRMAGRSCTTESDHDTANQAEPFHWIVTQILGTRVSPKAKSKVP